MKQQNFMSARALTMDEIEIVNGGIPSLMRQILKNRQFEQGNIVVY